MSTSQCKGCGQSILWRVTTNGKPMPLDDTYTKVPLTATGTYVLSKKGRMHPLRSRHSRTERTPLHESLGHLPHAEPVQESKMTYPPIDETYLADESRALLADIRKHGYTVTLDQLADAHTVRIRVHHGRTLVSRSTCTAGPDNAVAAGHAKWLRDVEVLVS